MTRTEYLLTSLAEEASEVTHSACKALRFGLDDVYAVTLTTPRLDIAVELDDVRAVVELLEESGVVLTSLPSRIAARKAKLIRLSRGMVGDCYPTTAQPEEVSAADPVETLRALLRALPISRETPKADRRTAVATLLAGPNGARAVGHHIYKVWGTISSQLGYGVGDKTVQEILDSIPIG